MQICRFPGHAVRADRLLYPLCEGCEPPTRKERSRRDEPAFVHGSNLSESPRRDCALAPASKRVQDRCLTCSAVSTLALSLVRPRICADGQPCCRWYRCCRCHCCQHQVVGSRRPGPQHRAPGSRTLTATFLLRADAIRLPSPRQKSMRPLSSFSTANQTQRHCSTGPIQPR